MRSLENKIRLFLVLALVVGCGIKALRGQPAQAEELYAVDGDSLEGNGRRIRLKGIDAPEYKQLCKDENGAEYQCGIEALEYIKKLMAGRKISCDCDAERDRYERELCVCYADDIEINKDMVRNGYAVRYHTKAYKTAENKAKKYKQGIWRGKFMTPALYRAKLRATGKFHHK